MYLFSKSKTIELNKSIKNYLYYKHRKHCMARKTINTCIYYLNDLFNELNAFKIVIIKIKIFLFYLYGL